MRKMNLQKKIFFASAFFFLVLFVIPQIVRAAFLSGANSDVGIYWFNQVGPGFTDDTSDANDSDVAGDVSWISGNPDTRSAYIGHLTSKFSRVVVDVSNVTSDLGQNLTMEYWNGSSWVDLVLDAQTHPFDSVGVNSFSFTPPSDWAVTTVNGTSAYYIRTKTGAGSGAHGFLNAQVSQLSLVLYSDPVPHNTPHVITYQGKVLENSAAVTTTKTFGFLIYDASSGGNLLYTASGTLSATSTVSITPSQGIFSVDLGGSSTNELATSTFINNTNLYLEVWVSGTKMTPRKQLTAAPYAINSQLLLGLTATTTSSSLYIPHSDVYGNFKFTGNPQSTGVGGGVIYVNPGSTDANETLFGLAVAGAEKFRVDADGDVFVTGAVTASSSLNVVGNTTLVTTTVNGNFQVGSVFFIDRVNYNVGINTSTPGFPLAVVGRSYFDATSTIQDIVVNDGIVLGGVKRSTWASGGTGDVIAAADNAFTGLNTFAATTTLSSTTINAQLNVDSGTFVVDAINNRVGIGTSTPAYGFAVSGTTYFAGATTQYGPTTIFGKTHNPTILSSYSLPNSGTGVAVRGKYAYVTSDANSSVDVVDVSNPSSMSLVGRITDGDGGAELSGAQSISVVGNYAYVIAGTGDALEIIDITNPKQPLHAGKILNSSLSPLISPTSVFVAGNYAYVTVNGSKSLEIVDISNPRNPRHAGKFVDATNLDGAQSVFVSGHYAYVVSTNINAMLIFDIADPASPKMISSIANGSGGANINYPYNVFVSGRYAFIAAYNGNTLEIVDVSDPRNPVHAGKITDGTDGAKLNNPQSIFVSGKYAYVVSATTVSLEIIDFSTASSPRHVASVASNLYLDNPQSVFVANNVAYVASYNSFNLAAIDVGGATIDNATIDNASVGSLNVMNDIDVQGGLSLRNGLTVGANGVNVGGDISLYSATSTAVTTNTIAFSNTARFFSSATSTNKNIFVFDTVNTYAHAASSSTYLLSVRNNGLKAFSVASNGDVAVSGTLYADVASIGTPGSPGDLAERVDIAVDDMVEPGDVVIVDPNNEDTYRRSRGPYEQSVAGVISTNPTLVIGFGKTQSTAILAMVGRVPIKVSAENGPIQRGDILVTASSTGYAMRYDASKDDDAKIVGIIGVALDSLDAGTGKIMGLVRTGWVNNRHQTIADIQQELTALSEAQAAQANAPQQLTVGEQNGQLTFLTNDVDARGKSIFNIGHLVGKDQVWEVDDEGRFITRLATSEGKKSLYSLQSGETEYVFSGSSHLQDGVARIDFDAVTREIIDGDKPLKINITLTSEARGVYVSGKDATGFVVKEVQGGTSSATFDYMVIATRKGKQAQEDATAEQNAQNAPPPANDSPPVSDVPAENTTTENTATTTTSDGGSTDPSPSPEQVPPENSGGETTSVETPPVVSDTP